MKAVGKQTTEDERKRKVLDLFREVCELPAEEQKARLDNACDDDDALRQEVESLLAYDQDAQQLSPPPYEWLADALVITPLPDLTGQILGRFTLLEKIGQGGMGEVWLAHDPALDRSVAVKVLARHLAALPDRVRRFQQEARLAAPLSHPNIVTIHEIGTEKIHLQNQTYACHFIVSEYIEGKTLRALLEAGRLDTSEVVTLGIQIAEALKVAHQAGIIHRDIKPENIMVRPDGLLKVVDFGIARTLEEQRLPRRPASGTVLTTVGTYDYLSPEQARQEKLDTRSDIFALGVLLYELLTGQWPFHGATKEERLQSLLQDDPLPLRVLVDDIPPALEEIVNKALQKNREERFATANDLLQALRRCNQSVAEPSRPSFSQLFSWHSLRSLFSQQEKNHAVARPNANAFHGLKPFQEADHRRFFGRDADISELMDKVTATEFRCGVTYGASGCGKTSLVKAGLMPRLRRAGWLPVYCRLHQNPLATLLEEVARQSRIALQFSEVPLDYLKRVSSQCAADENEGGLLLICDQFEEFFAHFQTQQERAPFLSLVAACANNNALPVKFLFAMRNDFLSFYAQAFDSRIAEPMAQRNRHFLSVFDVRQGETLIASLAAQANLPLEPDLCREVAQDLADGDKVLPSELQLVGQQLQRRGIHNVAAYRQAGGKEPLIFSFLEEVIESSGRKADAHLILRSLISEENTRRTLLLESIVKRTQLSHQTVEMILKLLVEARLVREVQDDEPWLYELMHEYLIEKINQLTGEMMDATQRAERVFRQYWANWTVDQKTRIPLLQLWRLRKARLRLPEREKELWRKSWRSGLLKLATASLAIVITAISFAAVFSMQDDWNSDEKIFRSGHTAAVRRAVFSPDGKTMISVSEDLSVMVWDFATRKLLKTLSGHTGSVNSVAFSPDGKWFATGSSDKTVRVWDAEKLEKITDLTAHRSEVRAVAFSPNGKWLASSSSGEEAAGSDFRTILWEAGRWEKVQEIPQGLTYGPILFSPDSRLLITSQVQWELSNGNQKLPQDEKWGGWNWAALSPDARLLVGTGGDGVVSFRRLENSPYLSGSELLQRVRAHQDWGRTVAFSPDGKLVATGAENIALWDTTTRQLLGRYLADTGVWGLTFSPDGTWLVSTHSDGSIRVWNMAERRATVGFGGHDDIVQAVAYSPDGKRIASAGEDGAVHLWQTDTRQKEVVLIEHKTRVTNLVFSPDGTWLVSLDQDGWLIRWNLEQHQQTWKIQGHNASDCLAISPNGKWLANVWSIFDADTGGKVFRFLDKPQGPGAMGTAAFSADGKYLATADNTFVRLVETQSWRLLAQQEEGTVPITRISFSPDGSQLVTGNTDGALVLWKARPLQKLANLGRHATRIRSLAFSPDGRTLATAGNDKKVLLWDVRSPKLLAAIGTHAANVASLAFSPDGKRLVTGEQDRTVRVYTRHRKLWEWLLD